MIKFWVANVENCMENGQYPVVIFSSGCGCMCVGVCACLCCIYMCILHMYTCHPSLLTSRPVGWRSLSIPRWAADATSSKAMWEVEVCVCVCVCVSEWVYGGYVVLWASESTGCCLKHPYATYMCNCSVFHYSLSPSLPPSLLSNQIVNHDPGTTFTVSSTLPQGAT